MRGGRSDNVGRVLKFLRKRFYTFLAKHVDGKRINIFVLWKTFNVTPTEAADTLEEHATDNGRFTVADGLDGGGRMDLFQATTAVDGPHSIVVVLIEFDFVFEHLSEMLHVFFILLRIDDGIHREDVGWEIVGIQEGSKLGDGKRVDGIDGLVGVSG